MTDIATISSVLSSIKTAVDIAKILKDSNVTLENAESKLKLAEIIGALADAKIEMAGVQELVLEKDRKIKELEDALETKGKLLWNSPYYWLEVDGKKEGPYCQKCYDGQRKLIRLQGDRQGWWECKECKNTFIEDAYRGPDL